METIPAEYAILIQQTLRLKRQCEFGIALDPARLTQIQDLCIDSYQLAVGRIKAEEYEKVRRNANSGK
jgi:hypothetical protein